MHVRIQFSASLLSNHISGKVQYTRFILQSLILQHGSKVSGKISFWIARNFEYNRFILHPLISHHGSKVSGVSKRYLNRKFECAHFILYLFSQG